MTSPLAFKYPLQSILLDVNLINDSDRTRASYGDLAGLAESITSNGLIHPPVVDTSNRLIAGGRRLRAIRDIIKSPLIPVLVLETLDDAHLAILEAEENIRRLPPTWQERVLGVAKVHEAAKRGAILDSRRWTVVETGAMLAMAFSNVNNMLYLAGFVRAQDGDICNAATISDALKILILRKEKEATKRQAEFLLAKGAEATLTSPTTLALESLTRQTSKDDFFTSVPIDGLGIGVLSPQLDIDEMPGAASTSSLPPVEIPLSHLLYKGDMCDLAYQLGAGICDHIITDPPYGIDMAYLNQENHGIKDIDTVLLEHDVASNLELFPKMFRAAYHLLKPNGFFIFWYDLCHHEKLQTYANEAGFRTQRWPLIWYKTYQCLNQFASKNFTKNFEVAMLCAKGNATLLAPQSTSIWSGTTDDLKIRLSHPFVKPLKLWQWLYTSVAMRGQTVLDPFAGVGSSTIAAIDFGLVPMAFELNDSHYDRLVLNTAEAFRKLNPNTKFI